MNMKIGRIGILVLLAFAGFIPVACDTSNGSTTETADVETNFGVGLASVIAAEGVPDSLVAEISIGGVVVDTMRPDLSTRTEAGVLRFPIGAPDGSHVSVYYRIYKGGGVVAVGQVSWVVGEQPLVPRPNLAPRVRIGGDADVIVRRNSPYMFHMTSSDTENALRALLVDRDGDGVMDDSIVPPTGRDSILLRWSDAGTYRLCVWARDDHDLRRRDTTIVRVVPAAKIAISQDTTVSVGDSVDVFVSMSYDDPAQSSSMQLVWNASGDTSTTSMKASRRFVWPKSGTYSIVVAATDVAGEASRDTMVVHVLQDAPKLDLSDFPRLVDLGGVAILPVGVEQSFGTIVRWGMDFDADTSKGWDTTSTGSLSSVQHLFGRSGDAKILVFVVDDDGNRTVSSGSISVSTSNSGAVLRRVSGRDTTLSVGDSAVVRFARSFPEGLESQSRVEWVVDGNRRDTTSVTISRAFAWSKSGSHWLAWRLSSPLGSTSWDTVSASVVSDAPALDLSSFPAEVGLNTIVSFSPTASQSFGSIVRWGMDFDGDTTDGWDTIRQGNMGSILHVFAIEDTAKVLVFAVDDDGNRAVGSHRLVVENLGTDLLYRRSGSSQRVSINDPVAIRFSDNFPVGSRTMARVEWRVDGLAAETLKVDTSRQFSWNDPDVHVVRTRILAPYGATSWDSTVVEVVLDAPDVVLDMPDTVSSNDQTLLSFAVKQEFGRILSWSVDFDGDTSGRWDSSGTGPLPTQILHSFPSEGGQTIRARVKDDDGNTTTVSRTLQVRKGAYGLVQRSVSSDTTVSVGDLAWVRLRLSSALESQVATSRLEWRVDAAASETLSVADARSFRWDAVGDHVVRFRATGLFGSTGWDSVSIHVVSDAPTIDFSGIPAVISVNDLTALRLSASQSFGRIVSWAVDYDGDTAQRWDTTGTGTLPTQFDHCFPSLGVQVLRVRVQDDDGNVSTDSLAFNVTSGAYWILQRAISADTTVSIRDSVDVRLRLGSILETQYATSRLEWRVDAAASETLSVADARPFRWDAVGDHVVRFRATGLFGSTGWDSVSIHVVLGVPRIVSISRTGIGVGKSITFAVASDPVFGRITRERWDFGNDGTWDDSSSIVGEITERVFPAATPVSIRVQVTDDDGNTDDSVFVFAPRNATPAFGTVAFTDPAVGVTLPVRLRASFSDPDGLSDLSSLSVDWNNDGTWDTTRTVTGLGSEEFVHSWANPGTKLVPLRVVDNSGAYALDTATIRVTTDAPVIASLREPNGRAVARIGDTLWFVASISDASNPADLDSARWIRDGMNDSMVSLRGRSVVDMQVPVFSRVVGPHSLTTIVADRVGNSDTASASWSVVQAPPFVKIRLRDSILTSRDTATLFLDSLRAGEMGGRIASAAWSYKGIGTWMPIPAPVPGGRLQLTLPHLRDSLWFVVVRTVQDNGETGYDTARVDLLKSFIDKRDGKLYPVIDAGGLEWMGKNLDLRAGTTSFDSVQSSCAQDDCARLGRLYTAPVPLYDQISERGLKHAVSVCPDGWRVPTESDFTALLRDGYQRTGLNDKANLRDRTSWSVPEPPQNDPMRFAAIPTDGYQSSEIANWWIYDNASGAENWRYLRATLNQYGMNMNGAFGQQHSLRCVRLKEFIVDSQFLRSESAIDSTWSISYYFSAYVPDSTAPVHMRISFQGQSNEKIAIPNANFVLGSGTHEVIALPPAMESRRSKVTFEMEQSGITWTDSQYLAPQSGITDSRLDYGYYTTTLIGSQRWMTKDVDYDKVNVPSNSDLPYSNARHYNLDSMFLGTAPDNGPSSPVQGICPEGYHIPSKAEWETLFASVTSDGLNPQTALRAHLSGLETYDWGSLPNGTDDYGFRAFPSGLWDGSSWNEASAYWAADANGYYLVWLDSRRGLDIVIDGPYLKSDVIDYAFPARCVGN